MSKFDQIIGYSTIKAELEQIADTLCHREYYERLHVSAPQGLLLYGEPGVGKSLMASAVIEASKRPVFTCRKDKPNGEFVNEIRNIFDKAIANAPSIVYLDDMDKFANEDERHQNAEEYVTVQACIDDTKEKDVFVLATVNDKKCLPRSLYRAGRFDRVIHVNVPTGREAIQILTHYLSIKNVVEGIDTEIIARIMNHHSCAELESVINEAGIYAGYERNNSITMEHLLKACLRTWFDLSPVGAEFLQDEDAKELLADSKLQLSQMVCHEAGHAIVSEILCPESVNFVAVMYDEDGEKSGVTNYYNDDTYTSLYWEQSRVISSLAGIVAVEQKYGIYEMGGEHDIEQAFRRMRDLVVDICTNGFQFYGHTYQLKAEQEHVITSEIEKSYRKAKEILATNWEFFERVAVELMQKRLLLSVDIQRIKKECTPVFKKLD